MATVRLTPAAGQVSGSESNMPLLVVPSQITNLGTLTLAEAQSARYYTDDTLVVECAREIVSADEHHFKQPTVSSAMAPVIDYDGIRADYAVGATYGAQNVWDTNYRYVSHDAGNDSTVNANNGTATGTTIGGVTGKIGNATNFDSGTDVVNMGEGAGDFDFGTSNFFVSAIIRRTRSNVAETVLSKYQTGYPASYWIEITADNRIFAGHRDTVATRWYVISSTTITDTNWHKITIFRSDDVSNYKIYLDGVDVTTNSTQAGSWDRSFENNADFVLGQTSSGSGGFLGDIDEVRLGINTNGTRELIEYNNQNANGTFWEAEAVGGGAWNGYPMIHMIQFNCVM